MTTSRKWLAALAVAATVSTISFSSNAAESMSDAGRSRTVKAWDLDLAKSADVETLYARLQQAANKACRDEARDHFRSTRRYPPADWTLRCVNDAVDAAVRVVGNRRLAVLREQGRSALL